MDCVIDGGKFILYNNNFRSKLHLLSVTSATLSLTFILLFIKKVKNCHFYSTNQKVEKTRKNL